MTFSEVACAVEAKLLPSPQCLDKTLLFGAQEIDVNTCSLSDVDFKSSFTMTCCQNGVLDGFIGYFDIGFEEGCSKKVL